MEWVAVNVAVKSPKRLQNKKPFISLERLYSGI